MGDFRPLHATAVLDQPFQPLRDQIPQSAFQDAPWQPNTPQTMSGSSNRPDDPGNPGPAADGLQEAYERGRQDAIDEMQAAPKDHSQEDAMVQSLIAELKGAHRGALDQAAADIGEIILAVVERVLKGSLALHRDALPTLVRDALAMFPGDEEIRIEVPEADAERVRSCVPSNVQATVVGVDAIDGGCKVQTRYASIERTVATALETVQSALDTWAAER